MSLFSVSLVSFWNSQDLSANRFKDFWAQVQTTLDCWVLSSRVLNWKVHFFNIYGVNSPVLNLKNILDSKVWNPKAAGWKAQSPPVKKYGLTNPVLKKIGLQGPICLEKNYGFDSPQCALGCIAPKSLGWSAHFLVYCRSMGWSPSVFWKSMDGRVQLYCKKNGLKSPVLSFKVSSLENLECEIVDWRVQFYCSTSMDWTAQFWISKVLDWRTHFVFTKLWAGEPNDFEKM